MHDSLFLELERNRNYDRENDDVLGTLYINGVAVCYTLEHRQYAIPTGLYTVEYCDSPKFGRKLPIIYNGTDCLPSRGLRIHAGNSIADTRGCVLVGLNTKTVGNNPYSTRLLESKAALDMLCKIIELNKTRPMALQIYRE